MLTKNRSLVYRNPTAGKIQWSGLNARAKQADTIPPRTLSGFFVSTHSLLIVWASMKEALSLPVCLFARSFNLHSRPFCVWTRNLGITPTTGETP